MSTNEILFELIRVAIGTQETLSRPPSKVEWAELYAMSKKQSLVGICFAAVQKLTQNQEPITHNLDEVQYLTWMGMAAKIQLRNEDVDRQCAELQAKLSADGFRSCILKGQGVAQVYPESLRGLRQSGDIDVWVLPNEGESENVHIARVVKYAKGFNSESHFSGKHIDLSIFADPSTRSGEPTEVELHVTPAKMNCPWHERRLKAWFLVRQTHQPEVSEGSKWFQQVSIDSNGDDSPNRTILVPTTEFNLVYLLLHCYDHLLFEGVGLRQIMDYYFVLLNANKEASEGSKGFQEVSNTLKTVGLQKFASAMMWVLGHVFAMDREYMICEPNEKEGRFLLNEIMSGGNFGKYGKDGVMEGHAKGKVAFFMARMKRSWRFLRHYPSGIIWSPYAMLTHWIWKRTVKL